jgi:hypothetical protein
MVFFRTEVMNEQILRKILHEVAASERSIDQAVTDLRSLPFESVDGFAKIDHHRALRRNMPEVIYCAGKTPEQTARILHHMAERSHRVLGTRATAEHHAAAVALVPRVQFDPVARCLWINDSPSPVHQLQPLLVAAGTSDIPVAEEAARTLEISDYQVERIYDIGVAGLHRLLAHVSKLQAAPLLIVCAGMEGALPSVIAGLVACPVIAVPTSVGYGASFGGLAALLGMLNSCSPGIAVVNIDNGFGAACLAVSILNGLRSAKTERP